MPHNVLLYVGILFAFFFLFAWCIVRGGAIHEAIEKAAEEAAREMR